MGDKIIFPFNYEGYLKKGLLAFEQGDLEIAEEWIGKALTIKKPDEIIQLYIMLLQETDQHDRALRFIEDHQSGIATDSSLEDLDFMYIKSLIQTGNFEASKKQIAARKNQLKLTTELAFTLQELETEIEKEELKILEKKLKKSTEILKAEKHISDQNFQKQQHYTTQLKDLDDDYFIKIAQRLLLNKKIHRLLKTEVLHQCIQRKLDTVIKACLSTEEVSIELNELLPLTGTTTFMEGSAYIDKYIANEDPTIANIIQNEFFMQLSILYPFEEQVIESVEDWIEILYLKYTGADYEEAHHSRKVILKIEDIENQIAELAAFFD